MHRLVVPKKSSAHRLACLALYRALLLRCRDLQRIRPELVYLQSHVRERFRRYKNLQSPSQTANALKAGYEALDLVDSAALGNEDNIGLVWRLLAKTQSTREQKKEFQSVLSLIRPVKQPNKKERKAEENRKFQEATAQRHPDATSILERPRPIVSGKRRIPVLVNASGIPFLRIKKPQPQSLSRMIRRKVAERQKLVERRERLEPEVLFGEDEDQWDDLTNGREQDEERWSSAPRAAFDEVYRRIGEDNRRKQSLARSMWEIVLAERKLAEEEQKAEEEKHAEEGKHAEKERKTRMVLNRRNILRKVNISAET
ncbi:hypothetical protein BDW75DRAFT_236739 [Aspergillus navahoensis]